MEQKLKVGILGATGMVGQRFISLLEDHPWFEVVTVAASPRSAGKTYEEAVGDRWKMDTPMPEAVKKLVVLNVNDVEHVASTVDFVFSAVDMSKEEIKVIEEAYAKTETPVVSNNSAHRWTPDVPMVVPEINAEHFEVIKDQKKRLGTTRGFIAVKPNCSIQSYAPCLAAWKEFGPKELVVTTYQAISGAGKTFKDWPEMLGNIIPFIGGEEEKSEQEPLRVLGKVENGEIVKAELPKITCQCVRVPVLNGHTAAVFINFEKKPTKEQLIEKLVNFKGFPQEALYSMYDADARSGVQKLIASYRKKEEALRLERERLSLMKSYERKYKDAEMICGIDEAGRGPLAGPVVAGAVILPKDCEILYLNDSKKLSASRREALYDEIMEKAVAVGVGMASPARIDEINILQATYEAMRKAVEQLSVVPDLLLNDAVTIPEMPYRQVPIVKGDAKSVSIAAASVIAKVTRDRLMMQYDKILPEYGFAQNKGYGSQSHIEALKRVGASPIHRRSFIKNFISEE